MNWRLIAQLSLLGLAMGVATVFAIPSNIEPLFWVVVFFISAYAIATQCATKRFLHGWLVGIANSVWVTALHTGFFSQYLVRHPQEAEMMASMPMPESPRLMMVLVGPVIGIVSGIVIGILAAIAGKVMRPRAAPVPDSRS